jgi:hypothetical protein
VQQLQRTIIEMPWLQSFRLQLPFWLPWDDFTSDIGNTAVDGDWLVVKPSKAVLQTRHRVRELVLLAALKQRGQSSLSLLPRDMLRTVLDACAPLCLDLRVRVHCQMTEALAILLERTQTRA